MDIDWIRRKVRTQDYEVSSHAEEERQDEEIPLGDVEHAVLNGMVLEQYPNDPRGQSCLVLGYGRSGYPIHFVCGKTNQEQLRVITMYIPMMPKWTDPETRSKK